MAKTFFSNNELAVLKTLRERMEVSRQRPVSEIAELAQATGISNSEEVQRALFILEGKNLVQPEPAGDLTSHLWQITDSGVKALDIMQS